MPRGDGTGPRGQGPGTGRGMNGMGQGSGGGTGAGPGGTCVCPNCGNRISHSAGQPCTSINCPNCGTSMTRGQAKINNFKKKGGLLCQVEIEQVLMEWDQ